MSNVKKTKQTEGSKQTPIERFLSRKHIKAPTIDELLDEGEWRYHTEGKYSDIVQHLDDWIIGRKATELEVIANVRVSDESQSKNQVKMLAQILRKTKKLGVKVHSKDFCEVRNGRLDTFQGSVFQKAVIYAREHGLPILVLSAERYLRRDGWTPEMGNVRPLQIEFDKFKKQVKDVTLLSIIAPDTPHKKLQSIKSKIGKELSKEPQGRSIVRKKDVRVAVKKWIEDQHESGKLVIKKGVLFHNRMKTSFRKLESLLTTRYGWDYTHVSIGKLVQKVLGKTVKK